MNKLKELWQYAVFRYCCYLPIVWFVEMYMLAWGLEGLFRYHVFVSGFTFGSGFLWVSIAIAILTLALWVWRNPIWNLVKGPVWNQIKRVVGFLNKKAEEG